MIECFISLQVPKMAKEIPPSKTLLGSLLSHYSMSRRLEDRIRRLSAQVVSATDPSEMNTISQQLKDALHEHVERLRSKLTGGTLLHERRQSRS
jgi:3-phenylpropionate/cinnamic acid dioxygenase small subunit